MYWLKSATNTSILITSALIITVLYTVQNIGVLITHIFTLEVILTLFCISMCVRLCVCARACVRARARVCVCVCVCVRARARLCLCVWFTCVWCYNFCVVPTEFVWFTHICWTVCRVRLRIYEYVSSVFQSIHPMFYCHIVSAAGSPEMVYMSAHYHYHFSGSSVSPQRRRQLDVANSYFKKVRAVMKHKFCLCAINASMVHWSLSQSVT